MSDVAANLRAVRARIEDAARRVGRDPAGIALIAVSKTKSAADIDAAIAAGACEIGENYVQEAAAKKLAVAGRARWHMIGHLQRNKAGRAVEIFDVVQTVDSLALGRALARHAARRERVLAVLIEVNVGGEASKSGVDESELEEIAKRLRDEPHLDVQGLMAIPPLGTPEEMRPFFRRLREWRDRLGLRELSMGMSDDFEVAIEEGATMVRVGRAIFGERR